MEKQKDLKVTASFKVQGNTAFVEFSEYVPLNFVGKRVLPILVAKALRDLGFYAKNVIFCRLADFGFEKDRFFQLEVLVPHKLLRHRSSFRLADLAKTA